MSDSAAVEQVAASSEEVRRGRATIVPVASWVLFDFATTIFSYVVLTRYFNEWIVIERGQPDIVIGVMSISVALALVVALPSLGALADRLGRHKPLLVAFTLTSVTGTALLGVVDGVALALVVAGIAIFAFNSAEAQYHPLLASVVPPHRQSRVSGIGVAIGYIGTFPLWSAENAGCAPLCAPATRSPARGRR
jgi:MFS transporter, UMF1 family